MIERIWHKHQLEAIEAALDPNLTGVFITGIGGSGKSDVTKEIVSRLKDMDEEVVIIAPTHSAAKMYSCATTIASFFKIVPTLNFEAEKEEDALQFIAHVEEGAEGLNDVVLICEEVSMLGKSDYKNIISKISPKKIILVGDPQQLPPVKDVPFNWSSIVDVTVELTKNFRATNPDVAEQVAYFRKHKELHPVTKCMTNPKFDAETTIIAHKNKTLSKLQKRFLGYTTARKGDILISFGNSGDHIRRNKGNCQLLPKISPYFNNNDLLEVMTDPVPSKYKGLSQVEVKVYGDPVPPEDANPKWPKPCVALVGDYDSYKKILRTYHAEAKRVVQRLTKKYGKNVSRRKARFSSSELLEWNRAWAKYLQLKSIPYARHHSFRSTYKSQGRSLTKVILAWDDLPDDAHKYVGISRAVEDIQIFIED